jgi:hypothetical protein
MMTVYDLNVQCEEFYNPTPADIEEMVEYHYSLSTGVSLLEEDSIDV